VAEAGASKGSARRSALFWAAAALILVLDLWSKHAVFEYLGVDPAQLNPATVVPTRKPIPGIGDLGGRVKLVALLNPGMMWGAFREHPQLLKVVRPLAVLVIFLLLSSLPANQKSARIALGAILGGALGNIWDSFWYAGVRDFLEVDLNVPVFDPFPAFNVADSAICVGVAVLALGMMRSAKQEVPENKPAAS
jgi:signal peptidase II